jgi:hypothetical protein
MSEFSGYTAAHFVPFVREAQDWAPWPDEPTSLIPNWEVYQVAFDKPGNERVTALWNGDGSGLRVRIRKNGTSAVLLDRDGSQHPAMDSQGWWLVDLAGATAHYPQDPAGYHFIGGAPRLLVEEGVSPDTPVAEPALGDPGSVPREFRLFLNPRDGQTVTAGAPADFFVNIRGEEGFADPVSFTIDHWSTQRFPQPQDPGSLPLQVSLPGPVAPGQTGTVHVETAGAGQGIYFIDIVATGGGMSKDVQLALVVD